MADTDTSTAADSAAIDISAVTYQVKAVTADGATLDLTPVTSHLGWEEGARELATRVSLRVADCDVNGKLLSSLVVPGTPLTVFATFNGAQRELVAATVEKWTARHGNGESVLELECYDRAHALTKSQDYAYFSEGHSTAQMLGDILGKWGVPFAFKGGGTQHNKIAFKRQTLADMVQRLLDDVKKKTGEVLFLRWKDGQLEITPRGANETVYYFAKDSNAISAKDSLDMGNLVTRVLIVGKEKTEAHPPVLATLDGKTEFGVRQMIVEHEKSKDLSETRKVAEEMLKEHGSLERTSSVDAPDVPTMRKGDKVCVRAGTLDGDFYVRAVRHNAADRRMTLDLDPCAAKGDSNESYEGGAAR